MVDEAKVNFKQWLRMRRAESLPADVILLLEEAFRAGWECHYQAEQAIRLDLLARGQARE